MNYAAGAVAEVSRRFAWVEAERWRCRLKYRAFLTRSLNEEELSTMLEQKSPETDRPPGIEQGTLFDKEELERLKVERQHWEETTILQSMERMPDRDKLVTTSNVPVNRVYTPQDGENLDYMRDLGLPGENPVTRGVKPTMYRAN